MAQHINAKGLSCPEPVILSKNAIEKNDFPIQVLVDSSNQCENIRRMAEHNNCLVEITEKDDGFLLIINTAL